MKPIDENEQSPILGRWRNVYLLIIFVLTLDIVLLYVLTKYFQ